MFATEQTTRCGCLVSPHTFSFGSLSEMYPRAYFTTDFRSLGVAICISYIQFRTSPPASCIDGDIKVIYDFAIILLRIRNSTNRFSQFVIYLLLRFLSWKTLVCVLNFCCEKYILMFVIVGGGGSKSSYLFLLRWGISRLPNVLVGKKFNIFFKDMYVPRCRN